MFQPYRLLIFLSGKIIGLSNKIGYLRKAGGNLLLSSRHSDRLLHQGSDRTPVKGSEMFFFCLHLDEAGDVLDRLLVLVHGRVEIGPNLKDLVDVLVVHKKEVIEVGIGNDHHLHIQIDRLRFQSGRGEQVKRIIGLNLELFAFQRPFKGLPYAGFHNGIQEIDHQVPAHGLDQRPGLDLAEIGAPYAGPVHNPLDAPEDISVGWITFHNDRRRFLIAVIHQQVDLIGLKPVSFRHHHHGKARDLGLLLRIEDLKVVGQIFQHLFEVCLDRLGGEFTDDRGRQFRRGFREGHPVHFFHFFLDLLLKVSERQKNLVDLFPQSRVLFLHRLKLISREPSPFRHGLHLVNVHRLFVHQGHHLRPLDLPYLNVHQGKTFPFDPFIQILEKGLPLGLIGLHDLLLHIDVFLALEELGDLLFQRFDKSAHGLLEMDACAPHQADQYRGLGILEIIHIAEIVRDLVLFGYLLEKLLDRGHPAAARHTGDKDIVPLSVYAHTEFEGLDRPLLSDNFLQGLQIVGGFERERGGIEPPSEMIERYFRISAFLWHCPSPYFQFPVCCFNQPLS